MTQWYYADRNRQRQGPIGATELADLFRKGQVAPETLVWRDGLPQWQALGDFAGELGLLDDAPAAPAAPLSLQGDDGSEPAEAPADAAPASGRAVFEAREPSYTHYASSGSDNDAQPDSPYAAPAASVEAWSAPVQGGEVVHAGLWRRFAASIIDSFVTGMLSYALLIPLMLMFGIGLGSLAGADFASGGLSISFLVLQYTISIGVPAAYFGWMQSSGNMASLGKMAVGVKVVRSDGERLSFWRSFLRYIALILFAVVTCGLGMLISGLMVAFTERKQGVHDMVCDTLVVDKWAFTDHPEWQQQGLGTVTIVVLAIFGGLMALAVVAVVAAIAIAAGAR
ncbi:MAG: RDD family protein [Pseudoxanthomonas sp.]